MNDILLNVESKEIRYAHLKNGQLYDLVIDRKKSRQITGNIYRGKVTNILHNIQSAFVDINEGENGFIHISDILENSKKFEEMFDMDFEFENESKPSNKAKDITQILKPEQPVLVQVVKEPIGSKGARLTSNISIAGRYLVLLPNNSHRGVSKKIEDSGIRDQLKKLIRSFEMPQDMGLICRTASARVSTEMLIEEATDLFNTWQMIVEKFDKSDRPTLLFEESDLVKRTLINCIDKRYDRLLIDDYATFQRCKQLYQKYEGEHPIKLEFYRDKMPMFERFNVEREIDKAMRTKIWLKSGGYLFFDQTEAMHTIDVNSGRSSTNPTGGDVEETLVRINLEAVEEIARQLRIRNIGGLVICDFIDMRVRKNQRRVLDHLKECMKEDSAKCTILGMSEFGLVEMTRQRNRESLAQTIYTTCPYCSGSGLIKSHESVSVEIERALKKLVLCQNQFALKLVVHPELYRYLEYSDKSYYTKLVSKSNAHLEFAINDSIHLNDFVFYSTTNGQKIDT
ncbi:MAG TPA: Rne/Rng family ribonuclease [Chlamydiales bacterium]|nr:Rne/Rng family ribonuclease [Chlamydiales bacterium]